MAKKFNQKAWGMLLENEKMALSLQYVMSKSSWEAGEIMDKSHYKYLEIKYRAETFLKMFTDHFEKLDEVIPSDIRGSQEVREYFVLCIEKRMKLPEVYDILNEKYGYTGKRTRELQIIEQMRAWEKSENAYELVTYNLIKEFDRWNNFRILPIDIQEPSAFKRRNKKVHLKHIKTTCTVPEISVEKIKKILGAKRGQPKVYMPIITDENKLYLIEIRKTEPAIKQASELNLYLFEDKLHATEYIELLKGYVEPKIKKCIEGLQFWPKYRESIKRALNYEAIQKIVPSRRYLQLALQKLAFH